MNNKKNKRAGKTQPEPVKQPAIGTPQVCGFSDGREAAASILDLIEKAHSGEVSQNDMRPAIFPAPGFLPGTLTLICSMPGQGNTAYLANIASELAGQGRYAAVFLPGLTRDNFFFRIICLRTGADYGKLRMGYFTREDWHGINGAANKLRLSGLYFSRQRIMSDDDI